MILERIARGIYANFSERATEWHMTLPALYVGLALHFMPHLFSTSTAYAHVAGWMTEAGWSVLFLSCAGWRFGALIINGTFRSFRWSPAIRMAVAIFSAFAWGQFTLGFFLEWMASGRATILIGFLAHATLVEFLNVFDASRDLSEERYGSARLGES